MRKNRYLDAQAQFISDRSISLNKKKTSWSAKRYSHRGYLGQHAVEHMSFALDKERRRRRQVIIDQLRDLFGDWVLVREVGKEAGFVEWGNGTHWGKAVDMYIGHGKRGKQDLEGRLVVELSRTVALDLHVVAGGSTVLRFTKFDVDPAPVEKLGRHQYQETEPDCGRMLRPVDQTPEEFIVTPVVGRPVPGQAPFTVQRHMVERPDALFRFDTGGHRFPRTNRHQARLARNMDPLVRRNDELPPDAAQFAWNADQLKAARKKERKRVNNKSKH